MALGDLTSRDAVIRAIEEYDRLGTKEFLRANHFGPALSYFLVWEGRRYDSKAIAGVAHNFERPDLEALTTHSFTGGEVTVVKKLRDLGFEVERAAPARNLRSSSEELTVWQMRLGDEDTRTSIQETYGGSPARGISAPAKASGLNDILLWWRPERGAAFGYEDGWTADGGAFYFSGMGQEGDQRFAVPYAENGRVRDHAATGDHIRLLRYVAKNTVRYLGELRLDVIDPWRWRDGYDKYGDLRRVIQFRFLPLGEVVRDPADPLHLPPGETAIPEAVREAPAAPSETAVEALGSDRFQRLVRAQRILAERKELRLVHTFRDWLSSAHGLAATGLRIPYAAEGRNLRADLFVTTPRVLVEAKSSAAREKIRLAIGQLLDYQRWIQPRPRMCVLVPAPPAEDMLDLLHALGIGAAWPDGDDFNVDPSSLLASL